MIVAVDFQGAENTLHVYNIYIKHLSTHSVSLFPPLSLSPSFFLSFLVFFPYVLLLLRIRTTYIYTSLKTTSKSNIIKGAAAQQHKIRLKRTRAEKINSLYTVYNVRISYTCVYVCADMMYKCIFLPEKNREGKQPGVCVRARAACSV